METVNHFHYHNPDAVLAVRLRIALDKTVAADDPRYARLPPPVRYRATGAIEAWQKVMEEGCRRGHADFYAGMRSFPLEYLCDEFPRFLRAWSRGLPDELSVDYQQCALRSLVWQIFYASGGAMYEPTNALHSLLEGADIASDVPVGMIELPAPVVCIHPNLEWRGSKEHRIRAIAVFLRHVTGSDANISHPCLSLATWQEFDGGHIRINQFHYRMVDPERTIHEVLSARDTSTQSVADDAHWLMVFDYVIKLLLYMKIPESGVVPQLAYSQADRNFKGLGQRKRTERLAQIEELYDRYIVGPTVLDRAARGPSGTETGGASHEKSGHWRRPHFKMQPHGPNSSLRKVVFIGPTIVRPDKIGM